MRQENKMERRRREWVTVVRRVSKILLCLSFVFFCGFLGSSCSEQETPPSSTLRVIATLKPLHSLVASLMLGRGAPTLLLDGRTSPHTTVLKPSQRKLLQTADLLVWVGPTFEVFLEKSTRELQPNRSLPLLQAAGLVVLPQTCTQCASHQIDHEIPDGHIWMDPLNGISMARAILKRLVALDPGGREVYEKNFEALQKELKLLDQEIQLLLKSYSAKPFFVVHQAYAYFVHRYQLQQPYTILSTPENLLSPQSLLALSEFLKKHPKGCVFFEPQFTTVFEKLRAFVKVRGGQIGKIDPIGINDVPGPGLYCLLLRRCARSLVWCFSNS